VRAKSREVWQVPDSFFTWKSYLSQQMQRLFELKASEQFATTFDGYLWLAEQNEIECSLADRPRVGLTRGLSGTKHRSSRQLLSAIGRS
jgi:hypothetical protein